MACSTGKVEHPTRDAAEAAQKKLVYDNHVKGEDAKSAGLNVYPCPDCGAWHVGHSSLQTPTAYHYGLATELDAILGADALVPDRPRRLPPSLRRKYTGRLLALYLALEERDPMVWFSWNAAWDFRGIPHPGVFVPRTRDEPASVRMHEGIVRIGVPASVVKLRWSDYLQRNKTTRVMRNAVAELGNPADWLATDTAVPPAAFRSIDVWHRGAWVAVGDVTDDEYAAYLAEPPA